MAGAQLRDTVARVTNHHLGSSGKKRNGVEWLPYEGLVNPETVGCARPVSELHPVILIPAGDPPPLVCIPAPLDHEAMVQVRHPRIRVLSAYWHSGWESAEPGAHLRSGVLERLVRVAEGLEDDFGLAVLDGWRSMTLQRELYEAAYQGATYQGATYPGATYPGAAYYGTSGESTVPSRGFVSEPISDPLAPAPHLTGGAVDVTLTWRGVPLALGTGFDDFSPAAAPDAFEDVDGMTRDLRRLLTQSMSAEGFTQDALEWWHFEYGTRRWAMITGCDPLYGPADVVLEDVPHTSVFRIITPRQRS